jgi:predicted transcriptional regulator
MLTDERDMKLLEIVKNHKSIDLKAIKEIMWKMADSENLNELNIGERVTRLYLKEYIRKSPNYDGYHITRKGRRLLEQVYVD